MKTIILFVILVFGFNSSIQATECVVLLHGLARTDNSLSKMEEFLSQSGYEVINDYYASTEFKIEELAIDIIPKSVSKCPEKTTIHFVTHSLGGILIRQYLSTNSVENIGKVVMLAPPNKGSEITDRLKDLALYDFINGPAGMQIGTDSLSIPNKLGPANFDVGIIAGNTTVNPILSTMLPNPDDGKVSVESTRLEGMKDHIEVAVSHTFIMNDKIVIEQVLFFLKNGSFFRSE